MHLASRPLSQRLSNAHRSKSFESESTLFLQTKDLQDIDFDDEAGAIRHFTVDANSWLSNRKAVNLIYRCERGALPEAASPRL